MYDTYLLTRCQSIFWGHSRPAGFPVETPVERQRASDAKLIPASVESACTVDVCHISKPVMYSAGYHHFPPGYGYLPCSHRASASFGQ